MKKGYLLGGLAVLGAIAVIAYLNKPKKNSEGFYNASGTRTLCRKVNPDGSVSQYTPHGGSRPCPYGGAVTRLESLSKL